MIERKALRRDVASEILERLASGRLPEGRLNETWLAAELGISRTPLREALLGLEQRGLIESSLGRGFLVSAPNAEEAAELYPLLATLEPLAMRTASRALVAQAPMLGDVLERMTQAADNEALLGLSREWTRHLLAPCSNTKLLAMLDDLHRLAARYEREALVRDYPVADALAKHQEIVAQIAAGKIARAATLVAQTWDDCLAALLNWLPSRAASTGTRR